MPLIKGKSQKSFEHNLKTEMAHGKPQGQALAIAYSMKRKAQHKAHGGMVKAEHVEHMEHDPHHEDVMRYGEMSAKPKHNAAAMHEDDKHLNQHKAHGGEIHIDIDSHNVGEDEAAHEMAEHEHAEHELAESPEFEKAEHEMAHGGRVHHKAHHMAHGDIVGRIMAKKYSKGGVVANEGQSMPSHQAGSKPREFDDLVLDDHLESHQKDYGEHDGDAREDHDRHDIVSKIMHSLAKKSKMPKGYPGL